MKIKLLLDVHITPKVAVALKRRFPALDVKSIHETDWAALPDEVLLELLDAENRVLVTRDSTPTANDSGKPTRAASSTG
ncbi:MAG: DUF5615 family PIN-like protein [Verrucomicrobiota bacterium]